MPAIGLYAHIPFCATRCDYCDFFVIVDQEGQTGFFELLYRDLDAAVERLGDSSPRTDTIYIGGGTPSFVDPDEIARLLDRCHAVLNPLPDAEITIEANPDGVTAGKARAWREAGVNRLSLGVQSFDSDVLSPRGRRYTGDEAVSAFEEGRKAGFPVVSIDLIAGLPGETVEGFLKGVGRAARLEPDHLSVYLLETGESLKASRLAAAIETGRVEGPAEEDLIAMYTGTIERLEDAGYQQYEISNFCKPGHPSRHNVKYWRSSPWIGIGPSAHSFYGGRRTAWPASLDEWRDRVVGNGLPLDVTLDTHEECAREALILQLRLTDGVDVDDFARVWRFDPREALACELEELSDEGLLLTRDGRLGLTRRGILLSNEVFGRLM